MSARTRVARRDGNWRGGCALCRLAGGNFLNWSGFAEEPPDDQAFPDAIAGLGRERGRAAVCVQFAARTATDAAQELRSVLTAIGSDYVDVLTLYYVERAEEWAPLAAVRCAASA